MSLLFEWIDSFETCSSSEDSQHIDTIYSDYELRKENWIKIAFDLYQKAINYINRNKYHFSVVMAVYINNQRTNSKSRFEKISYRTYCHQSTPPELYLVRDIKTIMEWEKAWIPLRKLGEYYHMNAFLDTFFDEDDKCYVRTVFFFHLK